MDGEPLELSVVMPCLDEADTLETCISKAQRAMREHGIRGEIVVADNGSTDGSPEIARFTIMLLDAWTFIPFMMIMILAGLQAIPRELTEAARVDGASPWKGFWEITFPLMLPVSITAVLIRIIFKLKLADIVINLTAGGPGGATDTVTSFIFREYRDRSNVGYGTLLAMFYLVIIIIAMTILMKLADRFVRPRT